MFIKRVNKLCLMTNKFLADTVRSRAAHASTGAMLFNSTKLNLCAPNMLYECYCCKRYFLYCCLWLLPNIRKEVYIFLLFHSGGRLYDTIVAVNCQFSLKKMKT